MATRINYSTIKANLVSIGARVSSLVALIDEALLTDGVFATKKTMTNTALFVSIVKTSQVPMHARDVLKEATKRGATVGGKDVVLTVETALKNASERDPRLIRDGGRVYHWTEPQAVPETSKTPRRLRSISGTHAPVDEEETYDRAKSRKQNERLQKRQKELVKT